ncbi:ATP-binding protein [Priestia aryabhattai]|uniref:ATP-binding protein n=1 Tax=Priestia aryabhattai TaxID=412384 RepID=UPI003D2CCE43
MGTPGIGDPYWYEWYVGLEQIIDMLNSDNKISYVIFQSDLHNTIDDVVVGYENKQEMCYQVKHEVGSLGKTNLTFHKLIEKTQRDNGKPKESLINVLAKGWQAASEVEGKEIIPVLYTNRGLGINKQKRQFCNQEYMALSLPSFIEKIQIYLSKDVSLKEIDNLIEDSDLQLQWREFIHAIGEGEARVLGFMNAFQIRSNEGSLDDLEKKMLDSLQGTFICSYEIAKSLFDKLCSNLRIWTTTRRETIKITIEDVYNALSIENDIEQGEHQLPYPNPFFESRKLFCEGLIYDLKNTDNKIVFISGDPGSGKTSLISYLQLKSKLFTARYHTFKPISPEQKFYDADEGLCKPKSLWNDLLIQLRKHFRGELHKYNIPVVNALCTVEQMRTEVLRLSEILYKKTNEKTILCIDGIDHAARSSMDITFLSSLYNPSEIPKGVCIVVVGQPAEMYNKYPLWIRNKTDNVGHYAVPSLTISDIKTLLAEKNINYKLNTSIIANFIFKKTKGNNLSIVFAIEEVKKCNSVEELRSILDKKHINGDINNYYDYIWKHITKLLNTIGVGFAFPDIVIASTIILLNGRLNPEMLSKAININFLKEDWEELLDSFYPLIQKGHNQIEYGLFHNDFRVFLMAVVNRNSPKYKNIAFQLAEYYLEQNEGTERLVNLIPMLVSAQREDMIAKAFDSKFVINSLAEGISREKLKEYASLAYDSALNSKDWNLFHSVYLAINTLHQHYKYFEYYDREYVVLEKSYSRVLHNYEMDVVPLKLGNLTDYREMLIFCKDLLSQGDHVSYMRAQSAFYLWMQNLTPAKFIKVLEKEIEKSTGVWDTNLIEEIIQLWGELSGTFNYDYAIINSDEDTEEVKASIQFNDAYFEYLLKNNKVQKSIKLITQGGVSYYCILNNLQDILLSNTIKEFKPILNHLVNKDMDLNNRLLAIVCLIDSDTNIALESIISDIDVQPITYITDKTSLTVILWSIIKGYQYGNSDTSIVVGEIYKLIDSIERKNNDFDYMKALIRYGVTLGQSKKGNEGDTKRVNDKSIIKSYSDFFTMELNHIRTFDFREGFRILLFLSFKEEWINKCMDEVKLVYLCKVHLFDRNQMGMYYKTIILDYLVENNHLDIVQQYIERLYGPHGNNLIEGSSFKEAHDHFKNYGQVVLPQLMKEVTTKIKWDVLGYSDHKEYALWPILEYYRKISFVEASQWKERGIKLYRLSYIANTKGSNRASYEIEKEVSNSAVNCGFEEAWELRQEDSNLRFSLELLYSQIFTFIENSKTLDEILTFWYLSCGILSWYNQEDRIGIRNIYNACIEKSRHLGITGIHDILEESSPNHISVATYKEKIDYISKQKSSSTNRDRIELMERLNNLSINELMEAIKYESFGWLKWDAISMGWETIWKQGAMTKEIANEIFDVILNNLDGYTWENSGCSTLIEKVIEYLGSDIAWNLAKYNKDAIEDVDRYYTCSHNMNSILQWICNKLNTQNLHTFFDKELECHYLWITGCGHLIEEFNYYNESISNLLHPRNLQEFALNILIEQLETQNAHRIEISLQGIQLLVKRYPDLFTYISESWPRYNSSQKAYLVKLSERWSQQNILGFNKLLSVIESEYIGTNELDKKIQLYLILKNYFIINKKNLFPIHYHAKADDYTLPSEVPPVFNKSQVSHSTKRYLSVMSDCTRDSNNDLLYFFQKGENLKRMRMKKNDIFRAGDSMLYSLDYMKKELKVLYGEDKKGRWSGVPVSIKAQSLLSCDDAWIISEMPKVSQNDWWNIENRLKENTNQNLVPFFKEIINESVGKDKIVVGACLWYPFGHKDGIIYTETLKLISKQIFIKDNSITRTLNPGSIISNMQDLFEIEYEDVFENGICLTSEIVGSSDFIYGNCMIYPSPYLRDLLDIKPLQGNPLVWVNSVGDEVMFFERITNPYRNTIQEQYFRQPLLSRWICNKELINKIAHENDCLCYLSNRLNQFPLLK